MKAVKQCAVSAAVYLGLVAAASPAHAIALGDIDTFQSGTTEGWHDGGSSPIPPTSVPDGGPTGAGDGYLQLTAVGGDGPGSRLAVISGIGWTGDYEAAGVTAIALDAINQGSTDLQLRLYFKGAAGTALSTEALTLTAGSDWTQLLFPVTATALTGLNPAGTLLSVNELRVYHSPNPVFPPLPVVATLGLDNIAAVPEPSTYLLWALGVCALVLPGMRSRLGS